MRCCGESMGEPYSSRVDSQSQPANEQHSRPNDASKSFVNTWCSDPRPTRADGVLEHRLAEGCDDPEFPDSMAPSTPFAPTAQRNLPQQPAHVHASQPEAKLCTGPQQPPAQSDVQMQELTSAVAAAAAAGAMSALQNISVSHLQSASGEQHKAFMNTARVAASAAAMRATGILSQPFNNCAASLDHQQPDGVPGDFPTISAMLDTQRSSRPSQLPNTSSAVNGIVRQILDHPVAGNAARTKSDGSAHLPGPPHDANRQVLQQSLLPEHGQQRAGMQGPAECCPDDADSLDVSGSSGARVSRSEQSLIKRLQLYAWVVRCSSSAHGLLPAFCLSASHIQP